MGEDRLNLQRPQTDSLAGQSSRPLARRLPGMADHLDQQGDHVLGIGQGLGATPREHQYSKMNWRNAFASSVSSNGCIICGIEVPPAKSVWRPRS